MKRPGIQADLFGVAARVPMLPGARNVDRRTSHEAAVSMIEAARSLRAAVYTELKRGGPGTRDEVARRLAIGPEKIWRRFSELATLNLIEATEQERPGNSGRLQSVWRVL